MVNIRLEYFNVYLNLFHHRPAALMNPAWLNDKQNKCEDEGKNILSVGRNVTTQV